MTTQPQLILDVSRLLSRKDRPAPTGIDRVELNAACEALSQEGLFLTTRGSRSWFVPRADIEALTDYLSRRWRAGTEEGLASARKLCAFLGADLPKGLPKPLTAAPPRLAGTPRFAPRRPRRPAGELRYRNVSHHHLEKPSFLAWLKDGWKAEVELFWHDAIPIMFPEYSRPGDAAKHRARLANALAFADLIEVNSQATADELHVLTEELGLPMPPLRVTRLQPTLPQAAPLAAKRCYFLVIGTLEPRKNHRMLLEVWRSLAREYGEETPALVVAGRRGWMNEDTFAMLDRSPYLQSHVIEAPELPDSVLAALIGGARALLMPSFAEGFGLPVAEAQRLGTHVVASDLTVFSEIAEGPLDMLPPEAGGRWRARIVELAAEDRT